MPEIVIKPQLTVSANKSYESEVWKCPQNMTQDFRVKAQLPIDNFQNTDLVIKLDSYLSDDGVTWTKYQGGVFAGGPMVTKNGSLLTAFDFSMTASQVAGKYVKVIITSTKRVKVTLSVETLD